MNKSKIGIFLAELRKTANMTQDELATKLFTSRENISKWERGINIPTPDTLLELSKLFNVSVNEILLGEKKSEENKNEIDNISIEVLKESNNKIKKIIKTFIFIIFVILMLFFIYYFFNSYNTIHVYFVNGENDKFSITNGIAIFSKERSYIKLGNISYNEIKNIDEYELLYMDSNGTERTIITSNQLDYIITAINNENQYYSYNDMNDIVNNSYLKIKYNNKEDIIKLNFYEDLKNDNLFQNNNGNSITLSDNPSLESNNDYVLIETYVKNNFKYNKEENQYSKIVKEKNKTINIYYSADTFNIFVYEDYNDGSSKSYIYNIINNELEYYSDLSGKIKDDFIYYIPNKQCISGKCMDNIVDYFKKNYLEKIK